MQFLTSRVSNLVAMLVCNSLRGDFHIFKEASYLEKSHMVNDGRAIIHSRFGKHFQKIILIVLNKNPTTLAGYLK